MLCILLFLHSTWNDVKESHDFYFKNTEENGQGVTVFGQGSSCSEYRFECHSLSLYAAVVLPEQPSAICLCAPIGEPLGSGFMSHAHASSLGTMIIFWF